MSQESIDKCKTKGRAITVTRLSDGSLVVQDMQINK
jgi:hypothetical protein